MNTVELNKQQSPKFSGSYKSQLGKRDIEYTLNQEIK